MKKNLILCFISSFLILTSLQAYSAVKSYNSINIKDNKEQNIKLEIRIPDIKLLQIPNKELEKKKIESEERSSWGSIITAIGSAASAILLIIGGISGYLKFNQERKDKQFIELSNKASSKSSLEKSNAISSLPLLIGYDKPKYKKSYNNLSEYLNQYYEKNPYAKESVSIIFNTLIHNSKTTSQEKHSEYSVIRIACSEALSEITQKSLNEKIIIEDEHPRCVISAICLDNKKIFKTKFHKIDLTGASLNGTEILQSDLTNSTFDYADLSNASFIGSNFCRSSFKNAKLKSANLNSTDLSYSDLSDVNLELCDFTSSNLYQAKFDNCKNTIKADFTDSIMSKDDFDFIKKEGVKKYLFIELKTSNSHDAEFIYKLFPDLRNKSDIGILDVDYKASSPLDKSLKEEMLKKEEIKKNLLNKKKNVPNIKDQEIHSSLFFTDKSGERYE